MYMSHECEIAVTKFDYSQEVAVFITIVLIVRHLQILRWFYISSYL